jgi:hypothetical protein
MRLSCSEECPVSRVAIGKRISTLAWPAVLVSLVGKLKSTYLTSSLVASDLHTDFWDSESCRYDFRVVNSVGLFDMLWGSMVLASRALIFL